MKGGAIKAIFKRHLGRWDTLQFGFLMTENAQVVVDPQALGTIRWHT
jgi:hypothetical protein